MASRNRRTLDRQRETEVEQPTPLGAVGSRTEDVLNFVVPQNDLRGYSREISRLYAESKDKFLAIGHYLYLANETLPHGQYELMIRTSLPFTRETARKLRRIYEAVRAGLLDREKMPHSYATAFEITRLTDRELKIAVGRDLIRPNVYLSEIRALQNELRAPIDLDRQETLEREKREAIEKISRLKLRVAEIESELRELSGRLTIEGEVEQTAY
jgi:hypothetical protein